MLSPPLVIGVSLAYLGLLFAVAWWGDRRAAQGRSLVDNAWAYALSMGVYCTAWTYFGSVGRAAVSGVWFLPIYLGPTLAMVLALVVLRKMIRIARRYRITSIADFIASRYGKSPLLAGGVTLITVVGIVPYIALQLKAIATGYALLTTAPGFAAAASAAWWQDTSLYAALLLAGFTMMFGTRQLDSTERHEGLVAAIAFESIVKLLAFLAVGVFVTWGMFAGPGDLFARAAAVPELSALLRMQQGSGGFAYAQWAALLLLSMLSVLFLPRQFQVMVVENFSERHLQRAAWVFPLYMLLINLFVLPIALGGLLYFSAGSASAANADAFVLSLPLSQGAHLLAMAVFIGGLSAATGMVIVEAIAVSTMVCNDLVMPVLLRTRWLRHRTGQPAQGDLTRLLLGVRRAAILAVLLLGYAYDHLAGEAYALVSIGLISFAAVAQFAPAALGGMWWKGGTQHGALAGLAAGFGLWVYTLMLPSIARSGWGWGPQSVEFMTHGPWGLAWLKPEALFGLQDLDNVTHSLFWSLLANVGAYVVVSLWRAPSAREASQAALFVDVDADASADSAGAGTAALAMPVFWRGRAAVGDLLPLLARFMGAERAQALFAEHARQRRVLRVDDIPPDAALVQFVETQLAGAIGTASARVMVASVVDEEPLAVADVMQILDEARQLRVAHQQLQSLDRLKDDFMSSVTHELRTPLTSIRALAELMADDPQMDVAQRQRFLTIVVGETERLSRLVNQVLDLAKIESGHAEWHNTDMDLCALARHAAQSLEHALHDQGTTLQLDLPSALPPLRADADRLTQVLLNLLGNAAKFVPKPGGHITLRVRGTAQGVVVQVRDNGPGVPPEQAALVFERFRQGSSSSQRLAGTGLGLPISRQIVEHFGGRIALVHDGGQGACFEVHLPWTGAGQAPAATTQPAIAAAQGDNGEDHHPDRR